MSQEVNFTELQILKEQFSVFSQKLEKQAIINEDMLKKAMTRKLSFVERDYRKIMLICLIAVPILTMQFILMDFHWGFILLMDCIALAEFYLNKRCYQVLIPRQLLGLSMTEATERVTRYKQLRLQAHKILAIPTVVLVVWTVLIACGYSWNLPIIAMIVCVLAVGLSLQLHAEKEIRKKLNDVLKHIKELNS